MADGTPLPKTRCQNVGCKYRARFFVGGSAGWFGHHCGRHAARVVQNMLPQVATGNHGMVILPFVKEAREEMMRLIPRG